MGRHLLILGTIENMARIPESDIAKIREATDLVKLVSERVVLNQRGRLFWGNCPFHTEKTPSFKIDPDTQLFHCFGCGAGGDAYGYVMRQEHLEFPEAVSFLADRAGIEIAYEEFGTGKRSNAKELREACFDAAIFYNEYLRKSKDGQAAKARSYLAERGFTLDDAIEWKIGYAPGRGTLVRHLQSKGHKIEHIIEANLAFGGGEAKDRFFNRIMFPISDVQGRVIAFGGRILGDGHPKYLNTNDTPIFHKSNSLYGIDKAKIEMVKTKTAIVVEGYTDVIALAKAGFGNAVATLGTALTSQHVRILSRYANRIIYVFDGDEAGLKAADRAVEFIDRSITPESSLNPIVLDVVVLPEGADPADIAMSKGGAEKLDQLFKASQPLIEFAIDRRLARWDLSRPEERARALNDAASVLKPISGSTLETDYAQYLVDKLWAAGLRVEINQILETIKKAPSPAQFQRIEEPLGEQASSTEPQETHSAALSADERLAEEALAFMIYNLSMRSLISSKVESKMISKRYRDIFELVASKPETPSAELIHEISTKIRGFAQAISKYNFEDLTANNLSEKAMIIVYRLKEMWLDHHIRELHESYTQALKTNPAQADVLIKEIAAAQKSLNELRSERRSY